MFELIWAVVHKIESFCFFFYFPPCIKNATDMNEQAKQMTLCWAQCGPASGFAAQSTQAKANLDQKGYE